MRSHWATQPSVVSYLVHVCTPYVARTIVMRIQTPAPSTCSALFTVKSCRQLHSTQSLCRYNTVHHSTAISPSAEFDTVRTKRNTQLRGCFGSIARPRFCSISARGAYCNKNTKILPSGPTWLKRATKAGLRLQYNYYLLLLYLSPRFPCWRDRNCWINLFHRMLGLRLVSTKSSVSQLSCLFRLY